MFSPDWLAIGKLIDVKANDNIWRVGKIMKVDEKNIEVNYDGWSRYTSILPLASNRLAPFRKYTLKYTGMQQMTKRNWVFSEEELQKFEKKLENLLKNDLRLKTPHKITQFFRGKLFIFTENLIENDYSSYPEMLEKVVNFFEIVMKVILKFLEIYPSLFELISKNSDPDMFLQSNDHALAATWPEILDLLCKLLALESRCRRFFVTYNTMPNDYVFSEKVIKKESHSGSFLYIFDVFVSFEGFEKFANVIKCLTVPIQLMNCTFLAAFKDFIDPDLFGHFTKGMCEGVISRIHNLTDKDIKFLESENLVELASMYITNDLQHNAFLQKSFLLMYCKMVKSSYLEKRIKGINEIVGFLENLATKKINEEHVAKLLIDEDVIKEIIETKVHGEVLKRSKQLFSFLAKKGKIGFNECEILWRFSEDQQKIISEAGFSLLIEVGPYIAELLAEEIYHKLISKPYSELNFQVITDYSKKILEVSEGKRNYCEFFLMDQLENSKDSKFSHSIVKYLSKIYMSPHSTNLVNNFLKEFPEKLSTRRMQTPHDLGIAISIFKTFNKDHILEFYKENNLKNIVLDNMYEYLESLELDDEFNSKTLYGTYTHIEHIESRFEFLEFLFNKINFKKYLRTKDLKKLWEIFVNNPQCKSDKMTFFKSINNGIRYGPLVNNHSRVFEYLFLDPKLFKPDDLHIAAYKAFKIFFFKANSEDALEINNEHFRYVKKSNIIGLETLFEIYFKGLDKTADHAIKLIKIILTSYSAELADQAKELFLSFLNTFLGNKDILENHSQRVLELFTCLLDQEKQEPMANKFFVWNTQSYGIISPSTTNVRSLRKVVAERLMMPLGDVCLKIGDFNYFHKDDSKIIKLSQEKAIVLVDPDYRLFEFVDTVKAIANCSNLLTEVYNNYISDPELAEKTWNFLSKIPPNDKYLKYIIDLDVKLKVMYKKYPQIFIHCLCTIKSKLDDADWKNKFKENLMEEAMLLAFIDMKIIKDINLLPKQEEVFINVIHDLIVPEKYVKGVVEGIFLTLTTITPQCFKLENPNSFIYQVYTMLEKFRSQHTEKLVEVFKEKGIKLIEDLISFIITENTQIFYFSTLVKIFLLVIQNGQIYESAFSLLSKYQEQALEQSKCNHYWVFFAKICEFSEINSDYLTENAFSSNHKLILSLTEYSITHKNYSLWGLLTINTVIIDKRPILIEGLFDLVSRLILGSPEDPYKCSCKHEETREAAYDYILAICQNNGESSNELEIFMDKTFHLQLLWRNSKFKNWNISLSSNEKSKHGFVGLQNLACICYMNSLFQQLYRISSFSTTLLQADLQNFTLPIYHLKRIFSLLRNSTAPYISPRKFCENFRDFDDRPVNIFDQMDVFEFYSRLMEKIEIELKGTNESRLVQNHFAGTLAVEMISKQCSHRKERNEDMLSVQLDVKSKSGLIDSLKTFIAGEILQGDNAYFCDECKKKVSTLMRNSIKYLPNFLVFALRRFEFNYDTMTRSKIDDYFEFPFEVCMKEYTTEYLNNNPLNSPDYYSYRLKGIIIHHGRAEQGHYYSFIHEGENWYEFNDTIVSLSSEEAVRNNSFGRFGSSHSVPTAYLLIYERLAKFKPNNNVELLDLPFTESCENIDLEYIKKKNMHYWLRKIALTSDFLKFNTTLLTKRTFSNSYIMKFFLTVLLRLERMHSEKSRFLNFILANVDNGCIVTLLNTLASENGVKEFFLFNPNPVARKIVAIMAKKCIDMMDKNVLLNFFLQYIKFTENINKNKSVYFVNYMDVLLYCAEKLPEYSSEMHIANLIIKLSLGYGNEDFPFTEAPGCDYLGYNGQAYKTSYHKLHDCYAISAVPVFRYLTNHTQDLSPEFLEYMKTQSGFESFFNVLDSKLSLRTYAEMYCILLEDEVEYSVNFCVFLLSKYYESQSEIKKRYLNVFSLFIKQHKRKAEIVKFILEYYLHLIPENDTQELIFYLNHFFILLKGIDYSYISESFPERKIEQLYNIIEVNTKCVFGDTVRENPKFINFMSKILCIKEENYYDDFNSDTDFPDSYLTVGNYLFVYDQERKSWEKGVIKERYDSDFVLVEYNLGGTKNVTLKDVAYDEVFPFIEISN
ncbi:hypothetical protein SteCoe_30490 [Stentor coeruleus]|uniref:USP domain-containing protein n=1 Tax=Stentor coeruleus TaxID=5963 RepID=A0A1R2B3H8_9CILI|nr:hypothetical protein SteCoe_30490 [Stentor coeruleus]